MKTILDTIIDFKKEEIKKLKSTFSVSDFEQTPFFKNECISLSRSIQFSSFGVIAEIKRKSPSAGNINLDIDISAQAAAYQNVGVAGISCLTDFQFFGGSNYDLIEIKKEVDIPVLRKEFIIDEFQIFEAKAIGADAILLIAEVLSSEEILHFTIMAQQLGMEVIMEAHDLTNLSKMNDEINMIGINNRNLHLQQTDIQTSLQLFDFLPKDKVLISESGIKTRDEINLLQKTGYHGALIGESILKESNPMQFIKQLNSLDYVH